MTVTVCFDALGTCFSLDPVVHALDELLGDRIREAGGSTRAIVNDWFHSAQRDYAYRSITSPPPPPISRFLTLSLPRALTQSCPTLEPSSLPDLSPVTSKLTRLSAQPGLADCFKTLKNTAHANILLITNGAKATTEGYVEQAGLDGFIDAVRSCDQVGLSKPFPQVYQAALDACVEVEVKNGNRNSTGQEREDRGRWFVAAHMWDLAAAKKAGFKTAYVLAEHPPNDKDQEQEWWDLWGGKPDIIGKDLADVGKQITQATR